MRALAFLFLLAALPAAADTQCQGNVPSCTLDFSDGDGHITIPTGASSCTIADAAGTLVSLSGTPNVTVPFKVPAATTPAQLSRLVTARCTDAFATPGGVTSFTGTFPAPPGPSAPVVSP